MGHCQRIGFAAARRSDAFGLLLLRAREREREIEREKAQGEVVFGL